MKESKEEKFYEKLKRKFKNFAKKISKNNPEIMLLHKYLMLVPDVFVLLFRLLKDKEIRFRAKAKLTGAIIYFMNPFDLFPEGIMGPIGFLEDLIIATYIIKKLVGVIGIDKIEEHWSGDVDIIQYLEAGYNFLNNLFSKENIRKVEEVWEK